MCRIEKPLRPPVYEFSVKYFIIYGFLGLIFTVAFTFACNKSTKFNASLALIYLQICFLLCCVAKYFLARVEDIPLQCYHPDLLPQEEYLALKRQYSEAANGLHMIRYYHLYEHLSEMTPEERDVLLKNYQDTMDTISPILDAQNELRALCSFKKTFGYVQIPEIYKEYDRAPPRRLPNSSMDREYESDIDLDEETSTASSPSTVNVDHDPPQNELHVPELFEISLAEYSNQSEFIETKEVDPCKDININDRAPAGRLPNINMDRENKSDIDFDEDLFGEDSAATFDVDLDPLQLQAPFSITEYLKQGQFSEFEEANPSNAINIEEIMKKVEKLETLEQQFAEIKAQNETLKESIEQMLESQTVF